MQARCQHAKRSICRAHQGHVLHRHGIVLPGRDSTDQWTSGDSNPDYLLAGEARYQLRDKPMWPPSPRGPDRPRRTPPSSPHLEEATRCGRVRPYGGDDGNRTRGLLSARQTRCHAAPHPQARTTVQEIGWTLAIASGPHHAMGHLHRYVPSTTVRTMVAGEGAGPSWLRL